VSWHCYGCGETGLLGVGLCACMRRQQDRRSEQMAQMAQAAQMTQRLGFPAVRAVDGVPLDPTERRTREMDEDMALIDEAQERARERYEHFVVETAAQALQALDSAPGLKVRLDVERQRANRLADECGKLRDENRELLVENATLRRQVERLERRRR